jgi:hypothetical protein
VNMTPLQMRLMALRDSAGEVQEWAAQALKEGVDPRQAGDVTAAARQVVSLAMAVERAARGLPEPE